MLFSTENVMHAARILGLFLSVPVFSSRILSFRFRAALAVLLALSLPAGARSLAPGALEALSDPASAALMLLGEALAGFILGWAALIAMGALRGAAVLITELMGLSLGGGAEALAGEDGPPLRSFYAALGMYVFLALDLHHAFIRCAAESFVWFPPGSLAADGAARSLGMLVLSTGTHLFEAALVAAFPVMSVLLLASVAQGALARVLPELDFFAFGFSLRAAVALGALVLTLPALSEVSQALLAGALESGREALLSLMK